MLESACENKGDVKILAVTVLTSLDRGDLDDLGFDCDPAELVLSRAKRALAIGCDGVISSGLEARIVKPALREHLDHRLLVVTPGIRPVENRPADDQKRSVDVRQAFLNGADHIVVGRPIRNAPDPRAAPTRFRRQLPKCSLASPTSFKPNPLCGDMQASTDFSSVARLNRPTSSSKSTLDLDSIFTTGGVSALKRSISVLADSP